MENTVAEMARESGIMRLVLKAIRAAVRAGMPAGTPDDSPDLRMTLASTTEAPLSSVVISSGLHACLFEGLVDMANGHPFRGLRKVMRMKTNGRSL